MKINLIILFFSISVAICYSQESAGTSSSVATFDLELAAELEVIFELDQNARNERKKIIEKYGTKSKEMQANNKIIRVWDSLNLIEIKNVLDSRGWLGTDVIGEKGNLALFLVIQKADLSTQLQYLPLMREAVSSGKAENAALALLEDRVAIRQGKGQIYGSQMKKDPETDTYYVLPLTEPDKVNDRRVKMGLEPIEEYLKNWNLIWDVEQHKARIRGMKENQ